MVALCIGFVAALCVAWAATMWNKPPSWVPLLAGVAVGILTYVLVAPESKT
ncbi:MAG: hypothetical protein WCE87_00825 [Candidatus Udaeobacter sp.]